MGAGNCQWSPICPARIFQSAGFTPAALISMASCVGPGEGISRSTKCSVSGPPNAVKTNVLFMVSPLEPSTLRLGLWRLIFSRSFSGVGFLFRRIVRVRGMFGWSIYGVQHQRLVTGIAEVVLGTCRNGALVAGLDG